MAKILFVLTSHAVLGDTGKETGFHFSEAAHVWLPLQAHGYEIDFVSPEGGKCPIDAFDLDEPLNQKAWQNLHFQEGVKNTLTPEQVKPEDYVGIYFVGGHGAMWDLPDNARIQELVRAIYENEGFVAAVCHGSAGLVNVRLSNGKYLVKDKKINCFTNEEEESVGLTETVPFLLAGKHEERGAKLEYSDKMQAHVSVNERILTGQNPASATPLAYAILAYLEG